jgi:transposase
MLLAPSDTTKVYLAVGFTDMRKAINGLSVLVEGKLELDPFSGHLFAFCNRRRNMVKILYWDRNGFCLWQKRLEKHRFHWPESKAQVLKMEHRQLSWLLDGLEIRQRQAHSRLNYLTVI